MTAGLEHYVTSAQHQHHQHKLRPESTKRGQTIQQKQQQQCFSKGSVAANSR
jgi:hypothetical protein